MEEAPKNYEDDGQSGDVYKVWQEALEDVEFAGDNATGEAETVESAGEELYDREYRENVNVSQCDLFTRRRAVIAEQFPALKPMTQEEEQRYFSDEEFKEARKRAIEEVPEDVRDEYGLLGTMVGRMEDGIRIGKSHSPQAEPTMTSREIQTEDGSFIVTEWKAKEAETDLARLHELHEKNAQIVDFSREKEVDIDSIPEDLQKNIDQLEQDMAALGEASARDFEPMAGKRPKTAAIYDRILGLSKTGNLSYETRKKIDGMRNAFERRYIMAGDDAKLREIDENIMKLRSERSEIATRQQKYEDAGFVGKMFRKLMYSKRMREDQSKLGAIEARAKVLRSEADEITKRRQVRGF